MSQLDELREIIVGDNSEQLSQLKARVEDIDARTRDVAEVLPPAIKTSIAESKSLIEALESPVSESLKRAIRREPREYAEILYPVMSPAIRRAITSAISSMFETINQTIESATTVQGIKARFQAMRTGVPYAELALRRSLLYRVEHVYLIERESGLLISELQNSEVASLDSDAVSAMFSAIQSFVQDSFSKNEDDRLTNFTVGQHNVWVVHGPKAMLACVIRGQAPASLRQDLYDVLDDIRTDFAQQIDGYSGDNSEFDGIEDYLGPCLQLKLKEEQEGQSISPFTWLFLIGLLSLLVYFSYGWWQKKQQTERLTELLGQSPGYVLTDMHWQGGRLHVNGLRDPLAELEETQADAQHVALENIDWRMKPFISLEPEMVLRRFRHEYEMPDSVTTTIKDNVIHLNGESNAQWFFDNETLLTTSTTVSGVDASGLVLESSSVRAYFVTKMQLDDEVSVAIQGNILTVVGYVSDTQRSQIEELVSESGYINTVSFQHDAEIDKLVTQINGIVISFSSGTSYLPESQAQLSLLASQIKELSLLLNDKQALVLTVIGQADNTTGALLLNKSMRLKRAQAVVADLVDKFDGSSIIYNPIAATLETQEDERSAHINVEIVAR